MSVTTTLSLLGLVLAGPQPSPHPPASDACMRTTAALLEASQELAYAAYDYKVAVSYQIADLDERQNWVEEAASALRDAVDDAQAHFQARLALCDRFGGEPYDPHIDPGNFVPEVDNPFYPLVPGTTSTFEKHGGEGHEVVVVTISDATREILGVECTIVSSVETIDGEMTEQTDDYFAQDAVGNVWYFGETTLEYEDGYLSSMDGSWLAGEDGAKPGIVMPAVPVVGSWYRQEYLLGVAEDVMSLQAIGVTVDLAFGTFDNCLESVDTSPIDDGNEIEIKSYAPGIGLVREYDVHTGEVLELVAVDR